MENLKALVYGHNLTDYQRDLARKEFEQLIKPHPTHKLLAVEGGGDWADASVDYFVNLTDRSGEDLFKEYNDRGGYHGNGKKWFRQWVIEKGYCRKPSEEELEVYYDGF